MCSVCKFLFRGRPEAANDFAGVEAIQRYKTMRNRLQSKTLSSHKTANDLEVNVLFFIVLSDVCVTG